jgi:hypothetical protein
MSDAFDKIGTALRLASYDKSARRAGKAPVESDSPTVRTDVPFAHMSAAVKCVGSTMCEMRPLTLQ